VFAVLIAPFGGAPAGTIQTPTLSKFDIKLNFAKSVRHARTNRSPAPPSSPPRE
jgi:hypothetical protein